MPTGNQLAEVLKSLAPRDREELTLLRSLLACAQSIQRRTYGDLGIRGSSLALAEQPTAPLGPESEAHQRLLREIPDEVRRYFDGLVEALEIYHAHHGEPLKVNHLRLRDSAVQELKQIREYCLHGGLHAVY